MEANIIKAIFDEPRGGRALHQCAYGQLHQRGRTHISSNHHLLRPSGQHPLRTLPVMDPASGHGGQEASSNPRTYIRLALREELSHLDLTGRASINNSRVVASGSFGDISKSQYTLGDGRETTVAVKRLRFYLKEDIDLVSSLILLYGLRPKYLAQIFEKEIYVWSRLHHPNVLSLLGFASEEPSGFPLLVSEWMTNGSSLNYVKNNNDCDLMRLV